MANPIDETGAKYISKINMNGTTYTINDAWARAEIAEVNTAIDGGVHFVGVSTTAIADGDAVKALTVGGSEVAAASQKDGDIFIYVKDGKNLEFIVTGGKYSELGSTGALGALAFKDEATGTVEIPISGAITLNSYTPQVDKGTLAVTTTTDTIEVTTAEETATGTFSPAAITIAASTVTMTPTKGTFSALAEVTYDAGTSTLTLTSATSDEFWKSATAEAAGQTVTPAAAQTISVKYQKATATSATFLSTASLTGDVAVTAAAPTATITNPTVTVTVA